MRKEPPDLLTTSEIARYLHLNEKKIYALVSEKKLPAVRISGKWLFPRALVEQFLNENSVVPAEGLLKRLLPSMFIIAGSDDNLFREVVYDAGKMAGYPVAFSVVGTHAGIDLLMKGQVHAATAHFPGDEGRRGGARGGDLISLALYRRSQGFMFPAGGGGDIHGAAGVVSSRLRFAVREKECSTFSLAKKLFKDAGCDIEAYDRLAGPYLTHREAARAVAGGEADVALGIRSAAAEHGLAFQPVIDEVFSIVLPSAHMAEPKVVRFIDALVGCVRSAPPALLTGYDTAPAGKIAAFGTAAAEGTRP